MFSKRFRGKMIPFIAIVIFLLPLLNSMGLFREILALVSLGKDLMGGNSVNVTQEHNPEIINAGISEGKKHESSPEPDIVEEKPTALEKIKSYITGERSRKPQFIVLQEALREVAKTKRAFLRVNHPTPDLDMVGIKLYKAVKFRRVPNIHHCYAEKDLEILNRYGVLDALFLRFRRINDIGIAFGTQGRGWGIRDLPRIRPTAAEYRR